MNHLLIKSINTLVVLYLLQVNAFGGPATRRILPSIRFALPIIQNLSPTSGDHQQQRREFSGSSHQSADDFAMNYLRKASRTFSKTTPEAVNKTTNRRVAHMINIAQGKSPKHFISGEVGAQLHPHLVPNSAVHHGIALLTLPHKDLLLQTDQILQLLPQNYKKISNSTSYNPKFDSTYLDSVITEHSERDLFENKLRTLIQNYDESPLAAIKFRQIESSVLKGCYLKRTGSSPIFEGVIVQGSREHVTPGIGDYVIDYDTHPVFSFVKHLAKTLRTDSTLDGVEKLHILQTAINRTVLRSPSYHCKALKTFQNTSAKLGIVPLSFWAKAGIGDCRPHSLLLAASALDAGISAQYANMFVKHGSTKKLTQENHSVVKFESNGKTYIADSYLPQFHAWPLEDLQRGVEYDDQALQVEKELEFPSILVPKQPLETCSLERNTGESSSVTDEAITQNQEKPLTEVKPQEKMSSPSKSSSGKSAH
ncbi:hypothetical protein EBS43_10780 [bacterium]|nr:hypothetical protein [bacterium]